MTQAKLLESMYRSMANKASKVQITSWVFGTRCSRKIRGKFSIVLLVVMRGSSSTLLERGDITACGNGKD